MNAILSDVIVLDLSRVLAGPYCTMMLGDMGATVIKVERPGSGDDTRHFGPPYKGGESAYYLGINRNKKSVELDFSTPEGKEQLLRLIRQATILVENFRPGTLEEKGLGYTTLREINRGLIYCSISSYGQNGPRASLPGYDFVAQAESGLMFVTGEVDGDPMPVGTPVVDSTAGIFACLAILAALRDRDRTGRGQHINISLLDVAVSLLGNVASNYLLSGEEAKRYGNGHPNIVPYQAFRTHDGWIALACGNDTLYASLCHVLGRDDLATDERFTSNSQRVRHRQELILVLQECLLQRTTDTWLTDFRSAGIPCGPIQTVSEVFHDPQLQEREMVWDCEHPTAGTIQILGSPMHFSRTRTRLYKAPPLLGEDNDILSHPVVELRDEDIYRPLYEW